jgi:hypothetical protein
MTTAYMNAPIFAASRAPKLSTAQWRAKLADLRVPAGLTGSSAGVIVRAGLALVPFAALAWLFLAT